MQVSLFNGFADKNPKPITIREVVEIIRADQRLQVLTENHRRYRAQGDTARAEAEKQHMPCYSVAVLFSGGKQQKHIVSYTGLSIVDLDHIPGERMAEVWEKVRSDEHTLLAYTTISGEGVRILARYALNDNVNDNCYPLRTTCSSPLKRDSAESTEYRTNQKELSPFKGDERRERSDGAEGVKQCAEQYRLAFLSVNAYYENLTGLSSDQKCKNATRISGMAHDSDVYYNPNAVAIIVDMMKKSVGRQGSYKSTWFHYLLPPELRQYFLPKLMSSAGITKDDLFKIAQSGLVCLEEIDHMKQRDLNQLKAITTMRTINERRSYGEFNEFHRHIASFCATGNNRFFLTDPTGNRRFLTFEVESIVPPQTYDYGYEGVYAQAYSLWRQGFRYWFNDEENAEINRRNTDFEAPNKEWELINKYYRRPLAGEECKFLTATDILERINASVKERLSVIRVGNALLSMGYERTRAGNLRGYRVVEIPYADIERKQKDMGRFTDTPNEDTALKGEEDMQPELPF